MTVASFQYLGISDETKERLNRLGIGVATMTVFPNLSAVGSWEEVLLFSMDFTVSQNVLELELQYAHFCLKKLAFAFLTDCLYWFLISLKLHIAGIIQC